MKLLEACDYDEFHIFGYSGLNDQHINNAIRNNKSISKIYYYAREEMVKDSLEKEKIKYIFANKAQKVIMCSRNDIWDQLR